MLQEVFFNELYIRKEKEIINAKPSNQDVTSYCNEIGISKASYYKWIKQINNNANPIFVEITPAIKMNSIINIEVNNVIIHVEPNYNSKLLLSVINTLKQL